MRRGAVGRGGGNRMTPVTPENYGMRSIVRPSAPPRLSYTKRDKSVDDAPAGLHGDVPRDSVRFVASDLSAEQSSAEREPTEAAAMADYQRSLFR